MDLGTFLGLIFVTAGSTLLGSVPVFFHHYFKESHWNWWESFAGGVMVSASFFSLLIPAFQMVKVGESLTPLFVGLILGVCFIFFMARGVLILTKNIRHQRAFLFVFVMGLHNVPEGLAVGVDVAALGWRESLPLTIAIFIQNLPEGLASSMSFLVAGFSVKEALLANAVTALIEGLSALVGFSFVAHSRIELPFLLCFAGACMMSVVVREAWIKYRGAEAATLSWSGFGAGLAVCGALDFLL